MSRFSNHFAPFVFAFTLAALPSGSIFAQEASKPLIGVVELYTSQGCSSCPPADAALETLIDRGDILGLAFHVPYWDYLGWKDTLATPEHEVRQRSYAQSFRAQSVYTPQAVINGREHLVGSRAGEIATKLAYHSNQNTGLTVPVQMMKKGDRIHVTVSEDTGFTGQDVKLVMVYYNKQIDVEIKRGENTGKNISYRNAVTATHSIGMWSGKKMEIEIPYAELATKNANGGAVLLQAVSANGLPGAILGAAILP
ncbi:MAG: DUF1223 domain-containing protein [Ahrensia sp.]|nr:DUF1223 domain-containing protein [Ahrensia sp.]